MALGSVLGAWVGSQLLPYAPSAILQVLLGLVLVYSAVRMAGSTLHVPARDDA
jgi:uncharacterized membrane protein YfcA